MYFKLVSIISIVLFLPSLVSAQIKPGPSGVVCVVDGGSLAALASDPGWKNPRVKGFLIRESWASLEPSEGTYDFALFDHAAQLAQQNGKFIGLAVGAGSLSPAWLYSAGARATAFSKTPGQTQAMPLPWDPIFQSAWASTIEALGNRYDSNPAVAYVALSGVGRDYSSPLALTADDVSKFDALGGQFFWSRAANDIADIYTMSFPHTQIILPLTPTVPEALGDKWVDSVASEQVDSHPGQFGLEASSPADHSLGSFPSISSGALSVLGVAIDSPQRLQQAQDWVQRSGLVAKRTFVEIGSRQMSWGEMQVPGPSGGQLVANTRANPLSAQRETSSAASGSESSTAAGDSSISSTTSMTPPAAPTAPATSPLSTTGAPALSPDTRRPARPILSAAAEAALCTEIQAAAWAAHLTGQPIWLSAADTNSVGTGTESDPLNVPTADRLGAALFFLSTNQVPNITFHFLPGTFYTMGICTSNWGISSGWQFLGSGEQSTILKIDSSSITYASTNKYADSKQVISENGHGNILVQDMTLDGSTSGFGSKLTASFAMPAPRATVTVDVANSAIFTVGKWVYVQDSVPTGGLNLYYGLMDVVAIPSSTQVTLMNCEVPSAGTVTGTLTSGSPIITGVSSTANLEQFQAISGPGIPAGASILSAADGVVTLTANATASGANETLTYSAICVTGVGSWFCPGGNVASGTTIPSTARVLDAICVNGITAGFDNDKIENVTVENVGRPFYEGPAGICLNGDNLCVGSLVQDCTVKDLWGTSSWIISLTDTNGVSLIGNSIYGNGYSQGYSLVGNNANAIISDNTAVGVTVGFFSDTGTKTNFSFTGNSFQALDGLALMGAAFGQSTFSNNTFLVTRSYGFAMAFAGVQLTNCTFSDNTINVAPGVIDAQGISLNPYCTGSTGNVFSDNVINSAAANYSASLTYGTQNGNVNQDGDEVNLELSE